MITRRNLALFIATIPITVLPIVPGSRARISKPFSDILISARKQSGMYKLGTAYLQGQAHPIQFQQLESRLVSSIGPFGNLSEQQLQRLIVNAVKNDFETGSVVNVDGWRLSKVEVLVAAMSTYV